MNVRTILENSKVVTLLIKTVGTNEMEGINPFVIFPNLFNNSIPSVPL